MGLQPQGRVHNLGNLARRRPDTLRVAKKRAECRASAEASREWCDPLAWPARAVVGQQRAQRSGSRARFEADTDSHSQPWEPPFGCSDKAQLSAPPPAAFAGEKLRGSRPGRPFGHGPLSPLRLVVRWRGMADLVIHRQLRRLQATAQPPKARAQARLAY